MEEDGDGVDNGEQEADNDELFYEIYEDLVGEMMVDFRATLQREPTEDELVSIQQCAEKIAEDMINEMDENEDEDDDEEKEENENLSSPLIAAAKSGDLTTVRALLKTGADKDEVTDWGRIAMWHAAQNGHWKIVRLLIEHGADHDKADKDRTYFGRETPLWIASQRGHLAVVRLLIKAGADMEKSNIVDWSPLYVASYEGHVDVVRYLLEQGANKDKALPCGITSLHIAAHIGHLETTKLLMIYGADLNARDKDSELPIDVARTEKIKQAIRDEPQRRIDHPNAAAGASESKDQEEGEEEEEEDEEEEEPDEQCNKRPRRDDGENVVVDI